MRTRQSASMVAHPFHHTSNQPKRSYSSTAAAAHGAIAISLGLQRLSHHRERCMLARERVHDRKRVRREQGASKGVCITAHSDSSQRARPARGRTGDLLASAAGSVERLGRACDRAHALYQRCGARPGHKDLRTHGEERRNSLSRQAARTIHGKTRSVRSHDAIQSRSAYGKCEEPKM